MKARSETTAINLNELVVLNAIKEKKKGIDVSPIVNDAQKTKLLLFPTEEKKDPETATIKRNVNFLSILYSWRVIFDFKKLK